VKQPEPYEKPEPQVWVFPSPNAKKMPEEVQAAELAAIASAEAAEQEVE
jgi:hypothetical protein